MSPRALDNKSLQEREREILEATLSLLDEIDVSKLTMDKVIERVPYSKGTVYGHFSCKEDLVAAIGNHALRTMIGLFSRAVEHPGSSRERFQGLFFAHLIWSLHQPTLFRTALCTKSPTVMGKTSPERLAEHDALEQKMMGLTLQVLDDGIADGSFHLPAHMSKQQITFSCWSSCLGVISMFSDDLNDCAGRHGLYLEQEFFNTTTLLLDGLAWAPLSSEKNYRRVIRQMLDKYFATELKEIQMRGRPLML